MIILKRILAIYINEPNSNFSTLSILSLIHSSKWILHPKHNKYIKEMDLFLDSFVNSKDLNKNGSKYSITPKAIVTLIAFEEEERKYQTQFKIQKRMMWATLAIAFFALVQLYLEITAS